MKGFIITGKVYVTCVTMRYGFLQYYVYVSALDALPNIGSVDCREYERHIAHLLQINAVETILNSDASTVMRRKCFPSIHAIESIAMIFSGKGIYNIGVFISLFYCQRNCY